MSDTPRTDDLVDRISREGWHGCHSPAASNLTYLARQLERELNAKETGLTKTHREQAERLEASVGARRAVLEAMPDLDKP